MIAHPEVYRYLSDLYGHRIIEKRQPVANDPDDMMMSRTCARNHHQDCDAIARDGLACGCKCHPRHVRRAVK